MIRVIGSPDLPRLTAIIGRTGLFPPNLLGGMAADHLGGKDTDEIWLTCDEGGPVAILFCAPEKLTDGTYNLLLIAVDPDRQQQGVGRKLFQELERRLFANGGRMLLVETSGLGEFEGTRNFYRSLGFSEEARIRDFYKAGEDKIVYRKILS
jgi:ribosomal protein S18 acetylase RimI-like enzyme